MLTFPRGLIPTSVVGWRLRTPTEDAVASLAGLPQSLYRSGGPFWSLLLDQMYGRGRNAILALRQLRADLGSGETPIIIRPCDCRQVPLAAGYSLGAEPSTAGAPYTDFAAGETNPIVASFAANASLRAAFVTLTLTSGIDSSKLVGAHFGVENATWGPRMHRIIEVTSASPLQVRIRPLLREAVTAGQAINFNRPGCVMRLDGDFAMDQPIPGRVFIGRAAFVEYERPVA